MSVLIGHASIDEKGKTKNGVAGDQTGREVCTREWYNNKWTYVLRCKDSILAEIMASSCEKACKNICIGYDQNQRNTLRTQLIKANYDMAKINAPCECDCSSLMTVCAECAGIAIPYSYANAPTTSTMRKAFVSTGFFDVLTNSKYLTSDKYLKRGDILVKEGHHTAMVLGDGPSTEQNTQSVQGAAGINYVVGKAYTLNVNLNIRQDPFGTKVKFSCITDDAQKHSTFDGYGNAILQKGTRVTCKAIKKLTNSTWMLIPSGWICAIEEGKVYVI